MAGTTAGPRLDNVPATTTRLSEPGGMATDAAGNLYITERWVVRKLDTSGIISTVAGSDVHQTFPGGDGGPATRAWISAADVAVDVAGNLYIADESTHRIRQVDAAGIITTVAGNGSPGFAGDAGPASPPNSTGPSA